MPIRQEKELEDLKSKSEEQTSTIGYLSMMSGVEIPEEESNVTGKDTQQEL